MWIVAAVLLEWLARVLVRNDLGSWEDSGESFGPTLPARVVHHADVSSPVSTDESLWADVFKCLRLLQGLLLAHRPSQRFFARKSTHEVLELDSILL